MDYRQATDNDVQDLKNIARRVINTNYAPFLGGEAVTAFIESGMSDKEIDDGLNDCTLMIRDKRTIGFAVTKEDLLHLMMIDVPFQNAGYGTALLAHIEEMLFAKYHCIRLQTFKDNVPTVHFYLKEEWMPIREEEMPELGKTMLRFEKKRIAD